MGRTTAAGGRSMSLERLVGSARGWFANGLAARSPEANSHRKDDAGARVAYFDEGQVGRFCRRRSVGEPEDEERQGQDGSQNQMPLVRIPGSRCVQLDRD